MGLKGFAEELNRASRPTFFDPKHWQLLSISTALHPAAANPKNYIHPASENFPLWRARALEQTNGAERRSESIAMETALGSAKKVNYRADNPMVDRGAFHLAGADVVA